MNRIRTAYGILFCLLLATAVYAQPQQDEPKSHEGAAAQQEKPEAKPEGAERQEPEKQENAKPEKMENQKEADRDKQVDKDQVDKDKDENKGKEKDKENEKNAKPASKYSDKQSREMSGQSGNAHAAGKGGHIPDNKFHASFGRQHTFHPGHPTMVNNQPGFVYGGYTFGFVDAWPADWGYTDDCYVDYIDGEYFLFDLLHPGMRIALFVVM